MKKMWLILPLLTVVGDSMGKKQDNDSSFILTSPSFEEGQQIPRKFTCQGENISPALQWSGVPAGTKSFALIMDDPDAPHGTVEPFIHWVLFNIPANITEFAEGQSQGSGGTTSFGHKMYGGPCPPSGTHRYFLKFYALDIVLDLPAGATKKQLLDAMESHIIAQAQLMGRYQKS